MKNLGQNILKLFDALSSKLDEILKSNADVKHNRCDHGVVFDEKKARDLSVYEVRKIYPRLDGECPKGCGYHGIAYASSMHYYMGDW